MLRLAFTICLVGHLVSSSQLPKIDLTAILDVVSRSCAILLLEPSSVAISESLVQHLFQTPLREKLTFARIDRSSLFEDRFVRIKITPMTSQHSSLLILERKLTDRSCLLSAELPYKELRGTYYQGRPDPSDFLESINQICGTFYELNGSLSEEGKRKEAILNGFYSTEHLSPGLKVSMAELVEHCGTDLKEFFYDGKCSASETCQSVDHCERPLMLPKCDYLDGLQSLSSSEFLENYVKRSRPVILKNALNQIWDLKQFSNDRFRQEHGSDHVHVKLTPSGLFEGVEPMTLWQFDEPIPNLVRQNLHFSSDLVLVRPAGVDMTFDHFLATIESKRNNSEYGNASLYLEYFSLQKENLKGLYANLTEPPFVKELLKLAEMNVWLSDGNTLGKLHFDQYDNLLCQVSGKKQLVLFHPHKNQRLYEGHIVEGVLSFQQGQFHRNRLLKSTSLTMSPVDITAPNFRRFPQFRDALPLNCTIGPGDILYMPSFWWHEVQSYPDQSSQRNLAFNYWYEPFLTKEFPCVDCKLNINPIYRHLL